MYAAAISRPFAQIFVNERTEGSPGIARVFFDFDFKGPPVSVPEICKVARYVQEVVGEYMNFESFSSSKETRRLIGTAIILGTKQFPTETQTFVAKDGTRIVNPSKRSKTAESGEAHGNDCNHHQNEVEGSGQEHTTQNGDQEGKSHEDNRNQSGASSSTTAGTDSVPYKSGFHIIFPFVYATPAQRKQLNVNVASVLNRCVPCHQFKEDWSKIVDPRVTDHLRMLGSRRLQGCPLECGKKPPSKLPRKQTKTRGPSSTVGDTAGSEDVAEDNKEILDVNEDIKVRPFVHLSTAPSSLSPMTDSISHGMESSSSPAGSASASSTETYHCFTPLSTSSPGSGDRDSLRKKSDRPKRKRVCPFCEGQEECIEDRSYVPLCVVDGHGDRDPKFELSLLDLRQAVDWTMIRAPSLWYNPDAGEIQPRTDVDESVIWDQLYGLYRDMKQTLDEDVQTQTSETESRLTDAYQFILKKKKLSQVDLRYLYHYTFLRLPSPRDMFGDDIRTTKIPQWKGWATYSSRPSFSTVSTPFTNVDEWDEFSFVDVDFHRYPEALDMESSPPSKNGKKKVRLSISEYDLERLPQDVRNNHSKQKAHQDEFEISCSDPRCERLMSVIRRIHQNYHQVLPRKVTYQPAVCTYFVEVKGAGSQYCMHREGNHKKNHVLFQISVNANPREPHLKAFQRCHDDECNKGFQNGQVRSAKKNAIIFTRDIQSHLSVLRPDLDDTEIHNIMHHGTRSFSPPPLSSRRDGNGNKREGTQGNTQTTAQSNQAPSFSLFPPPPSHRSTPFLPDATAPPVSFDAHLKEKKMKAAKVRLERLWHQLGTRHRQICNCGKESDRLLRLSQSVLKTWWESVLRKKKKKRSDSLPPSSGPPECNESSSSSSHNQISDWWRKQMDSRSVIPDNVLEIIDSLFLAEYLYTREEFLNEIKDLPARLKGTFREYLNLLCFWFGTQASYKSVLLSNKTSNNDDDEARKDGKNDKGRRAASLGNPSHVVSSLPGSLDDVLNNYCNLLLPHVGRKKVTKVEETPSASTPDSGAGPALPSPENSHS
jgi:hypothetical protein